MNNINNKLAKELAKLLKEAGIFSDSPETPANPLWAAQQAFYVCYQGSQTKDWRELKEWLSGQNVPRAAYYRKMAELCHRALRRPNLPVELSEPVAFAWGYFEALLKAKIDQNIQPT